MTIASSHVRVQEASSNPSLTSQTLFESLSNLIWTNEDCPPEITLAVCEVNRIQLLEQSARTPS
jgi:hypothetical protein